MYKIGDAAKSIWDKECSGIIVAILHDSIQIRYTNGWGIIEYLKKDVVLCGTL